MDAVGWQEWQLSWAAEEEEEHFHLAEWTMLPVLVLVAWKNTKQNLRLPPLRLTSTYTMWPSVQTEGEGLTLSRPGAVLEPPTTVWHFNSLSLSAYGKGEGGRVRQSVNAPVGTSVWIWRLMDEGRSIYIRWFSIQPEGGLTKNRERDGGGRNGV